VILIRNIAIDKVLMQILPAPSPDLSYAMAIPSRREINQALTRKCWVKLSISDIFQSLRAVPNYSPDNIFFFNGHPILWVSVAGRVTTIEEYENQIKYTDDGTGQVIEVVVERALISNDLSSQIDISSIIKARGVLDIVREEPRLIQKEEIGQTLGFHETIEFWTKMNATREDLLRKPYEKPESFQENVAHRQ